MMNTQQSANISNLYGESLDAYTEGSIWSDVCEFLAQKRNRKGTPKLQFSVCTRHGYGKVSVDEKLRFRIGFGSTTGSELLPSGI